MAYDPPFSPRTTLKKTIDEAVNPGDTPWVTFDSVVFDPTDSADLTNKGVTVVGSGLYLAGLRLQIACGASTSGDMVIWPNCQGAAGPDISISNSIPRSDDSKLLFFTWFFYMNVAAPDTFSIELDNNTDAAIHANNWELSLVRVY